MTIFMCVASCFYIVVRKGVSLINTAFIGSWVSFVFGIMCVVLLVVVCFFAIFAVGVKKADTFRPLVAVVRYDGVSQNKHIGKQKYR